MKRWSSLKRGLAEEHYKSVRQIYDSKVKISLIVSTIEIALNRMNTGLLPI